MPPSQPTIGPLILAPTQSERIWGVQSLEPWFPITNLQQTVGEMWLTDERCRIASGSLSGSTLGEAATAHPQAFGGSGFPLLIKILFPADKLSVQVHPDDAQAQATGQPRGKTECWYILSAEPGATVAVGFSEKLTPDQIRAAIADGTLEDKMAHLPVHSGDMVFVDAGTVHAIGPGVVILETQQYSDITYRLFDYGRPRELHLEQGLAVTRTDTAAGLVRPTEKPTHTQLVQSPYFTVDRFTAASSLGHAEKLQILVALTPGSRLTWPDASISLPKSHAIILPAENTAYSLVPAGEVIRILP